MEHTKEEAYTLKTFFQKLWIRQGAGEAFRGSSKEDFAAWQQDLRGKLEEITGWNRLCTMEAELGMRHRSVRIEERKGPDGITEIKEKIETLPGVWMPYWILLPKERGTQARLPLMLCFPAHGANKETVAEIPENAAAREKIKRSPKEAYGRAFARRGYLAVCPDPAGFGERQEDTPLEDRYFGGGRDWNPLGSSCRALSETAASFGLSLAGIMAFEQSILLSSLKERSDLGLDSARTGCAGFSGGGMLALWLAALDPGVGLCVVSGYLHRWKDTMLDTHLCPCNCVPGVWNLADLSDVAELIAPRPLFAENGTRDIESGRRGIEGPREAADRIREAYALLEAEKNFVFSMPEGLHAFHGTCYDFVDAFLKQERG